MAHHIPKRVQPMAQVHEGRSEYLLLSIHALTYLHLDLYVPVDLPGVGVLRALVYLMRGGHADHLWVFGEGVEETLVETSDALDEVVNCGHDVPESGSQSLQLKHQSLRGPFLAEVVRVNSGL